VTWCLYEIIIASNKKPRELHSGRGDKQIINYISLNMQHRYAAKEKISA